MWRWTSLMLRNRWLRESLPWLKLSGTILAWVAPGPSRNPRADHRRHSLRCSLSCAWKAGGYQYHLARSAAEGSVSDRDFRGVKKCDGTLAIRSCRGASV